MKIYLAAQFNRNSEMRKVRDRLRALGHTVIARWIDTNNARDPSTHENLNSHPQDWRSCAVDNITDIVKADLIACFTSADGGGKGGRHVEFGLALGLEKQIVIIGPRENIFHTLPIIKVYPNLKEFIDSLSLTPQNHL